MQHLTGALSLDLGMAQLVSDIALVDARVMDPLAPIGPPAVPAIPGGPGAGGCRSGRLLTSFARRSRAVPARYSWRDW